MTDSQSNKEQPDNLNPTTGDYALIGAKALASVVPLVGGPITELLDLITPPLEKRRDAALLALAHDVQLLKEQGVNVAELFENEGFLSTLLYVIQASIRTHQEGKREALRNAALNAAMGRAPSEDLQHMFISYVTDLTESHLLMLIRFKDQPKGTTIHSLDGKLGPTERAHPQFAGKQDFIRQMARELKGKGLLQWDAVLSNGKITQEAGYTTHLGDEFIQFITVPPEIEAR